MKNSIVIILAVCLFLPFSGIYIFFHLKEKQLKNEVNAIILNNLEEKDLVVLKFSEEETRTMLTWKHSREFVFDGFMYDIVEQGVEGDTIWYKCYLDHKETRLNAEKEKLIAKALGNDPFQKKQTERIEKIFKTVFQDELFSWNPDLPLPSTFHYSVFTIHYSLFTPSPPTPPPEFL